MNFFKKNLKKISLAGFFAALLMIGSTNFANAGFLDVINLGGFFGWMASAAAYVIGYIAGGVFWVVGFFVQLALNLNLHITEPTNLIVQSGWNIILNITNLGFVLAIIVIAFATVINYESYAIKKTIWKLIVAALLVNFSFVIAGAIVDVANTATQFMMQKSGTNDPAAWGSAMAAMFQPQQFLSVDKNFDPTGANTKGITEGSLNPFISIIASIIFGAVFTFIAAMTLFTVGVMLFVRYVTLSFLLMFSPIIWLARVFPFTAKYWSMWWQRFLKWTFFAPIMMFFMYLALRTMSGTVAALGSVPASFAGQSMIMTQLSSIGQLFLVIGIMMGGLYVANELGMEGSKGIIKAAQGANKGFIKGTQGYIGRQATKVLGQPFAPGAPGTRRSRFNAWLGANKITAPLAKFGQTAASYTKNNPAFKPGAHKGFFASTLGGAWKGSGLGKKTTTKVWECQVCKAQVLDKNKPTYPCKNGHPASLPAGSPPGTPFADWKEI